MATLTKIVRPVTLFPPEVWLISVATFVNRAVGFLGLFAAVFFSSLAFTPTTVALALFTVGFAGVVGSIAGGRLAEKYDPTFVLIAGSAANIPILFSLALVDTNPSVVLGLSAMSVGVSQSFLAPAATLVTESSFSGDTATVFAFYRIFINVGSIVAPAIVGLLGSFEFTMLFVMSGIGSIVTTLVLVTGRNILRGAQGREADSESEHRPGAGSIHRGAGNSVAIWAVVIVFGFAIAIYAQHQSGIPLSVERLDNGTRLYAILLLINPAIIIGCELPLNYLLSRIQWRYSYVAGVVATGVGLAMTGLGQSWLVCIFGFVVFSLGEALFAPQASAAVAKLSGPGMNARNQGYLSAAQTVGIAIGPAVGAYAVLNARIPFWYSIIGLSVVLGAVLLRATVRSTR